jgi:hypothetical protein
MFSADLPRHNVIAHFDKHNQNLSLFAQPADELTQIATRKKMLNSPNAPVSSGNTETGTLLPQYTDSNNKRARVADVVDSKAAQANGNHGLEDSEQAISNSYGLGL